MSGRETEKERHPVSPTRRGRGILGHSVEESLGEEWAEHKKQERVLEDRHVGAPGFKPHQG